MMERFAVVIPMCCRTRNAERGGGGKRASADGGRGGSSCRGWFIRPSVRG